MSETLILASGSPRRKKLLALIDIPFRVAVANVDEQRLAGESPTEMVGRLSGKKASAIAEALRDEVVIGADTIVVLGEKILEKPGSPEIAREMLLSLQGKTHYVYTGVTIICSKSGRHLSFVEKTDVTFGQISPSDLEQYIATGTCFDKAGGYGIQDDRGALFVKKINGDFYNVMGLPVFRLYQALRSDFNSLFS